MNFGPQTKKVIARILTHPKCSYAVSWRKSIRHVVLGYSFWSRLLALLREEFTISKLTLHSYLGRRAASRRALHCPSSYFYCVKTSLFETYVLIRCDNCTLCATSTEESLNKQCAHLEQTKTACRCFVLCADTMLSTRIQWNERHTAMH